MNNRKDAYLAIFSVMISIMVLCAILGFICGFVTAITGSSLLGLIAYLCVYAAFWVENIWCKTFDLTYKYMRKVYDRTEQAFNAIVAFVKNPMQSVFGSKAVAA